MTTPPLDLTLFGDEHVRRYRETDGEEGYLWNGVPTLILTTVGRSSGQLRDHPMICAADGPNYVVIASQGGAPTHPQWYLNTLVHPEVQVQVKADRFAAIASTVEGSERDRLWELMNSVWPRFDVYQSRTDRVIPVVQLTRWTT